MTGSPQGLAGIRETICPAPLESLERGEAVRAGMGCAAMAQECRPGSGLGREPMGALAPPGPAAAVVGGRFQGWVVPGLPRVAPSVPRTSVLAGSGIFSWRLAGSRNSNTATVPLLPGLLGSPSVLIFPIFFFFFTN